MNISNERHGALKIAEDMLAEGRNWSKKLLNSDKPKSFSGTDAEGQHYEAFQTGSRAMQIRDAARKILRQ